MLSHLIGTSSPYTQCVLKQLIPCGQVAFFIGINFLFSEIYGKLGVTLFFLLLKSCKIHIVKEMKRGSYTWQN